MKACILTWILICPPIPMDLNSYMHAYAYLNETKPRMCGYTFLSTHNACILIVCCDIAFILITEIHDVVSPCIVYLGILRDELHCSVMEISRNHTVPNNGKIQKFITFLPSVPWDISGNMFGRLTKIRCRFIHSYSYYIPTKSKSNLLYKNYLYKNACVCVHVCIV